MAAQDFPIEVEALGAGRYRVTVDGGVLTQHEVRIPPGYLQQAGLQGQPPEALLRRVFAFLLEREPNTAILERFELPVVGDYFPEFPAALRGE